MNFTKDRKVDKMKKILLSLTVLMMIVGCSSATAKSKKETATYLESVDEYGSFMPTNLLTRTQDASI